MDSPLFLAIRLNSPKLLIDGIYRDRAGVAGTDEAGRSDAVRILAQAAEPTGLEKTK